MHDILAFIATIGIAVECTSYQAHKRLTKKLQGERTELSAAFEPQEWYDFAISKFKSLPETHADMTRYAFWNKDMNLHSKDNVVNAWATLFTSHEKHETTDLRERAAKKIAEIVQGEFNEVHTDDPYIRINNPHLNNSLMTPIYFPMAMKFALGAMRQLTDMRLERDGYARNRDVDTGCVFWEDVWDDTLPILFFVHGIGIGVAPYAPWIHGLRHGANLGGIVLLEMPGISGQPVRTHTTAYPTAQEIADVVKTTLAKYSQPVIAMGHSYGTMVLSYCMNYHPGIFTRKILIDSPIFFVNTNKFWSELLKPTSWGHILDQVVAGKLSKAVMGIFFAEIHIQHLLKNATWFCEYCSWETDLSNTLVVLSGRDDVVASKDVETYLAEHHPQVETWMYPNKPHGGLLTSRVFVGRLVDYVRSRG